MSTLIKASCQCGQLVVTSTIPNDKLPLALYICSCNICRWLSGTLGISSVNVHLPIEVLGRASKYATSTGPRGLDRCFCPVCGTFVYENCPDVGRIGLFGGAMEKVDRLVEFRGTIYAASTTDGGMTVWAPGSPAFIEDSVEGDVRPYALSRPIPALDIQMDLKENLECACLCGKVHFSITRPNQASYELSSLYSDSLVPFREGAAHLNAKGEKWWIRSNGTKYAAAVCACNSCRLSSGQDLVQWAFVPASNIMGSDNQPYDPRSVAALTSFKSAERVTRYFCSTCGANVFWTSLDRPLLIDVAVGLLRSRQGSRAEDWLDWLTQRISFVEDAQNKQLVGVFREGMQRFHQARKDLH